MSEFESWKDELLLRINTVCSDGVATWASLVDGLGTPEKIRTKWVGTFVSEVEKLMQDMKKDLEEKHRLVQKLIQSLRSEISDICYDLGIAVSFPVVSNLHEEEEKLKQSLNDLRSQLQRRQDEVKLLVDRQAKVCATLGRTVRALPEKPLPSASELENFLLHIETLEDECFLREEKYTMLQCELRQLADDIDYEPASEFEEHLLKNTDCVFEVNDKNMFLLNSFHHMLTQHASNIKTEVQICLQHIRQLWEALETDEQYCNAFLDAHKGYKKHTILALKMEIKRMEDLKKANINMLVTRLYTQLAVEWDKCHLSEDQRKRFDISDENFFTESMHTNIQNELRKLKQFYIDNKNLFEALEKYAELCKRISELESPEQGQNRYKNRGGRLLLEEKERKLARKRLEKLEQAILQMRDDFLRQNREEFTYQGLTVEEYIRQVQDGKDVHCEMPEQKMPKLNSKIALCPAKSSNLGIESITKIPKPSQPGSGHISPPRRRPPLGAKNDDAVAQKTQKSTISGLVRPAPAARDNRIKSRRQNLRKAAKATKLQERSKLTLKAVETCIDDGLVVVKNYNCFKEIIDTSMPSILVDSMAMESLDSTLTGHDSSQNLNFCSTTLKSEFKNVTMRKRYAKN